MLVCVYALIKTPSSLWPNIRDPTASKWAGIKNGNSPLISSERCKGSFIIEKTWNSFYNPCLSLDGKPIALNWLQQRGLLYVLPGWPTRFGLEPHWRSACLVHLVFNVSREWYLLSAKCCPKRRLLGGESDEFSEEQWGVESCPQGNCPSSFTRF